jgi:hypothetical protein
MKNQRGLSAVITTLIIIGLVLVAIGIVWYVVSAIIEGTAEDVDYASRCLGISVEPTYLNCVNTVTPFDCTVKIQRSSTSKADPVDGVEIILYDEDDETLETFSRGDVLPGQVVTINEPFGELVSKAEKVSVRVYFLDSSDNKHYCSNVNTYP